MSATREKTKVPTDPKNPDFFEWLEKLFAGASDFPEKIEVRAVSGPQCRQLGGMVKQILYKPNAPKPTRESLVALSNEILHLTQRDCDAIGKMQRYGVLVYHFMREDSFYTRYLLKMLPKGENVVDGAGDDGEDALDEDGRPKLFQQRLLEAVLKWQENNQQMHYEASAGIMDRLDRVNERQAQEIDRIQDKMMKLMEIAERALSQEAEREERRKWSDLKVHLAERGSETVLGLLPVVANRLAGNSQVPAGQPSPESMALTNVMKSLTHEQSVLLFGDYSDGPGHELTKPGILNPEQAKIVGGVAMCQMSPNELDRLLVGPLAISADQVEVIQASMPFEKLMPLVDIIMQRKARLDASNPVLPEPANDNNTPPVAPKSDPA